MGVDKGKTYLQCPALIYFHYDVYENATCSPVQGCILKARDFILRWPR